MKVGNKSFRSIWEKENNPEIIQIIDQRRLPHEFIIHEIRTYEQTAEVIKEMYVRGAPLIGVTAAYGIYLAAVNSTNNNIERNLNIAAEYLINTRPTAINLKWAVDSQLRILNYKEDIINIRKALLENARKIAEEDVTNCKKIGEYGAEILKKISRSKNDDTVNILTHCNAGWLATTDYGTATAPIYIANNMGIKLHVWVDETRPRNQGAKLTSWELNNEGISNTLIVDNAGGHLMQHGLVDIVIVGSDRTTYTGDVANKIGTYLKALAAKDNNVPFYVALPSSTIDWTIENGFDIPIEERNGHEVQYVDGLYKGKVINVLIPHGDSNAANYAFDITPRHLVKGLITERGICKADKKDILRLFPEKSNG